MKLITVDIGSTFIKAGLFDTGQKAEVEQVKYATPQKNEHQDPSRYENRAVEFVDIVKKIIHEYVEKYPDTEGILFSTQQHGCVIQHPDLAEDTYISWQDTRCLKSRQAGSEKENDDEMTGSEKENGGKVPERECDGSRAEEKSYMEELQGIFSREDMQANGVYIKPALALCNLYALFESGELTRLKETKIDTLGSYIIGKLTGNRVCHITNAAPMGFANVLQNTWRWDMLEKVNLDFIQLPDITDEMECCGYYEAREKRIAVFPDAGDVQTCVYGTDAGSGDLVVNIGTSGQIIYVTDEFHPGPYEIRPFYEKNYCNVISCMPGGRNFDVQIDYVRDIGEKIFHVSLERGEVWERIHQMGLSHETEGLKVDCGFYELPERLADGNIRHINHSNLTLEHVIWATAVDFGRTYQKYAQTLCGEETGFDPKEKECPGETVSLGAAAEKKPKRSVYFIGGALLKNKELQEAIRQEMGISQVICAEQDEVFRGMQKLALRCAARLEEIQQKV